MFKRSPGGIPRKQGSGAHLQFADAQRKGSCQGVGVNAQCRMDPDDLDERLRRLLKKRAALHKHILARRVEKVDNTVHLQILNARFAKEVRAMLAEGLTMDQVGQELGMSSEEIFALL